MYKKHIHFIGIGGTAMAALARTFKKAGFKITGSETIKPLYYPMKDYLDNNKLSYYQGFSKNKIAKFNRIDEVVVGNAFMSQTNPEILYAKKNNIPINHYPKLIENYLIKKNSVVVAGTYGKTTTTAMLVWLMDQSFKKPNYMVGGIPVNLKHGARLTKSNWSIIEGDEYPAASPWDWSPKFDYYHPKYLILTSAEWDHKDVYKTQKAYIQAFKKLVSKVPKDGLIVANLNGKNIDQVIKQAKCRVIFYSLNKSSKANYWIEDIEKYKTISTFSLIRENLLLNRFRTKLLGDFNIENWLAALIFAYEIKLPVKKIEKAVLSFKGIKRRLEIRFNKEVTIIDDFAHSPSKAKAAAETLKSHFKNRKISVIFEPNKGNRRLKDLKNFDRIFSGIDRIIIPQLSHYKDETELQLVGGKELAIYLRKTHKNVSFIPNSNKLIDNISKNVREKDVIAFLGSSGSRSFDTAIKTLIKRFN